METSSCSMVAKTYFCSYCHYTTSKKSSYNKHLSTEKHNVNTTINKSSIKVAKKYTCLQCDYTTYKRSSYDKHLSTGTHSVNTTINKNSIEVAKSCQQHICEKCNKIYNSRVGLWKHMKICIIPNPPEETPLLENNTIRVNSVDTLIQTQTTLILELVKQNQEFKQLLLDQNKTMIEVAKNSQGNNTINQMNNSNNNNKTFNLQFFLNETCKDAMNMKDFIQSLEMSFSELEKMGEIGFAEGMSRLFIDRLNKLDITKRPIHCSDVKREIIHIKDDNKWERDNANLDRLRKIIKQLTHKNILRVDDWKQANKGCTEYNSRKNEQYLKMNIQAIGPVDDDEVKREFGKIIRRVAESTAIDKKYLVV